MRMPVVGSRQSLPGLFFAATVLVAAISWGCSRPADLIVVNANIYTVDSSQPRAQAFAIRDGRFVAVGDSASIGSRFTGATLLDAGGRTIIPGLIDSHGHLVNHGVLRTNVDLRGTASFTEVIERLRSREQTMPDGEWLRGRGWDQNDWAVREYPTRADLDPVFPDRPVWLERVDGHASLLNTAALRLMQIDAHGRSPDPEGGRIVRDESGDPTGLLIDAASDRVDDIAPLPSPELLERGILTAMQDAAAVGMTGVHDPGLGLDTLRIYRRLAEQGRMTLRVYGMTEGLGSAFEEICRNGPILGYRGVLTVRTVKFYADGALGSRGAALLEDYSDDPGNTGLMRRTPEELKNAIEEAVACGLQPAVHAIGDAANRVVLDIYEELARSFDLKPVRPRIEHAQIVSPVDLQRFKDLGVIAAMQPTHATSDMYWAEDRVGRERLSGAYAWRTLIDLGVHVPFGSDFPVESIDPLKGFYAAVTRQDAEGYPAGGWLPEQRLSREEALRAFTLESAYAGFMESEVGSITEGKLADFVMLDRDIMTAPIPEILGTRVVATYFGGRPVFTNGL